jgi:hypothetical protein
MKALAVLVTLVGLAAMVAWYGFLEPPFLSYRDMPFEPLHDVRAGEHLALQVTRCSNSDEEEAYLITRRLIRLDPPASEPEAAKPRILAPGAVSLMPGCTSEISLANPIPPDTAPGIYFVQGLAKVDGMWRSSKVPWSSRPFNVLPAAAAPASAP